MLIAKQLDRVFLLKENGTDIRLTDPEPSWSVEAVMNFYANTYPILTTAKISAPRIEDIRYSIVLKASWEQKVNLKI